MSGAQRPTASPDGSPPSPCTNVCVLDRTRRLCTGCARTVEEITRWSGMTDAEKRAVLAQLPQRRGH